VVYRDEGSVKCEGLFLDPRYPRGGREKDNRKRKDSRNTKIVEEEKIVDEASFGREIFLEEPVCVAGNIFFLNSRKGALAI